MLKVAPLTGTALPDARLSRNFFSEMPTFSTPARSPSSTPSPQRVQLPPKLGAHCGPRCGGQGRRSAGQTPSISLNHCELNSHLRSHSRRRIPRRCTVSRPAPLPLSPPRHRARSPVTQLRRWAANAKCSQSKRKGRDPPRPAPPHQPTPPTNCNRWCHLALRIVPYSPF